MQAELESVMDSWRRMQSDGLDLSQPLEWGFFFMHRAKDPLQRVYAELEPHGYVLRELDERDDGTWVLHVSKTETLEPEKLHRRNISFNDLAAHFAVDVYDGWDVSVPQRRGHDA